MTPDFETAADLGLPEDYDRFPAAVTLEGAPYWLVRTEDGGWLLLYGLCPHAGGEVIPHGDIFYCPLHYWTFDQKDGVCQNERGERLMRRKVERRENGRLYAVGGND